MKKNLLNSIYTPGTSSQEPLAEEVLVIGCDRYPKLPLTVENYKTKGVYSSLLVKYSITWDFTENQGVLFDPIMRKIKS